MHYVKQTDHQNTGNKYNKYPYSHSFEGREFFCEILKS
nr:MAG TPA: hypothetical protein [Caudoviricetes sp.]